MKLLIAGSRDIENVDLSKYITGDVDTIISGGAKGIDTIAEEVTSAERLRRREEAREPAIPFKFFLTSFLETRTFSSFFLCGLLLFVVFHLLQLGAEIDRLAEAGLFKGPIQDIIQNDLGVFGVDEIFGLDIARLYGAIGQTNFGDIDVNKPGIVKVLNEAGKPGKTSCHTFLDDIVGAIAAAAATRVSQIISEETARKEQ